MARKLQDRLALASYKTQHGQEGLIFSDVEARLYKTLEQKRPSASIGASSTSSLSSSERHSLLEGFASSPITAAFSFDNVRSSGYKASRKRSIHRAAAIDMAPNPGRRKRSQSMAPPIYETSRTSWKRFHRLPESSPTYPHAASSYPNAQGLNASFASEGSTIPASPPFGPVSDDENDEGSYIPAHSFSMSSTSHASPPRTPPPTRSRDMRQLKPGGEEGADLLLYLATSPSHAIPGAKASRVYAPSTPPPTNQALPSSMMFTPGMTGFGTPGQQFNFADFVNVTPGPAQGAFGSRTPGLPKTPLAANEARRRPNFDALVPPGGSPNLSNVGRGSLKDPGLGMELGGELVSR